MNHYLCIPCLLPITNSYFSLIPVTNELYLASSQRKSHLFMHWASWKGGVAGCNAGWQLVMCGELRHLDCEEYKYLDSVQSLFVTPKTG